MTFNDKIKVGQKFQKLYYNREGILCSLGDTVWVIYSITEKRVCYTDGKKHSSGATNRRVNGSWLTLQGFKNRIDSGLIRFVD